MSECDLIRNSSRCGHRGCNKQFREIKRILKENQTMLCEMKLRLRKLHLINDGISQQMTSFQEAIADIRHQLSAQQEIMNLFYKEYQFLKKRQGKAQLMNYIRMRESMLKDLALYEEQHRTHTMGYKLLTMYKNELTEILEDQSVEILTAETGKTFDSETQKPIERIRVFSLEQDKLIHKVFNCGYRWNGVMLKKIDVSVCVYVHEDKHERVV